MFPSHVPSWYQWGSRKQTYIHKTKGISEAPENIETKGISEASGNVKQRN